MISRGTRYPPRSPRGKSSKTPPRHGNVTRSPAPTPPAPLPATAAVGPIVDATLAMMLVSGIHLPRDGLVLQRLTLALQLSVTARLAATVIATRLQTLSKTPPLVAVLGVVARAAVAASTIATVPLVKSIANSSPRPPPPLLPPPPPLPSGTAG